MNSIPPNHLLFGAQASRIIDTLIPKVCVGVVSEDMVVFSHLRWEFVKQRPQHLMERLSAHRKIIFVEEPIDVSDEVESEAYGTSIIIEVAHNITVVQPRIYAHDIQSLAQIVRESDSSLSNNPILWFYSGIC